MVEEHPRNTSADSGREEFGLLRKVLRSIATHRDLSELFRELAQSLHSITRFNFLSVALHVPARNVMRLHILEGSHALAIQTSLEIPVEGSPAGWVWQSQQPLVIPNVEQESRFPKFMQLLRENAVKSFCVLPLSTAQRPVGTLGLGSLEERAYCGVDLEFLQEAAGLIAIALDNALNYQNGQSYQQHLAHERDRLRVLLEVNNALVTKLDTRELLATISTCLREVMHHDYTALVLHDPETNELRVRVLDFPRGKGLVQEEMAIPVKGTPVGEAFTSRKPQLLGRADLERFPPEIARRLAGEGVKSACSLPLMTHNRVLGTLNLASLKENAFRQEDLDFLGQVASQVAIAMENTMAYQEIAELKDKLAEEKLYLEDEIRTEHNFGEIVGESAVLKRTLRQVETVAPADSTVLIQGETGTGKELIARAIHNLSPRRERTFVKINCAAIPTGLLESELFGHEKGAFTGAIAQKIGRFELAHRGTLFLDEVGDIPLELQPKLLRVLQEKELERLGSTRTIRVDVRLVAATNRDLAQMVEDRSFRNDLYYRLNVFPILMPPLRERPEDISLLVRYFVQKYARQTNKQIETIPTEAMKALARYQWPGNVRELENLVERSVLLTQGSVLHVPPSELKPRKENVTCPTTTLEDAEREHILRALRDAKWAVGGAQGAAVRLGMKRTTLYSKMKKLRISPRNR